MSHLQVAPPTPADAAMDWLLRRDARPLTPSEKEDFQTWLETAENREAYAALETLWAAAGDVEDHPRFAEKRRAVLQSVDRRRFVRRAMAAGLVAGLIGLGGLGAYSHKAPRPLADQSFQTAVGQRATVTLPDGSSVTLNTDTVVRTRSDAERRVVYLDKGQAFFRVAKDRRHPFVVTAAGRTVTALGTAFDVRVDRGALKVVLVEGRVRVESAAKPSAASAGRAPGGPDAPTPPSDRVTEMSAGSQLVATTDADWRLTQTDVRRETSWLNGQLVFDDEALSDVVAELNRYSTRKIVITDEGLAQRRLSGIYTPGDVHGFARALRATGVGRIGEETDQEVRIVAIR